MTDSITTPSPDICVECGGRLDSYSNDFGWSWGSDGKMIAKSVRVTIYQWFRVRDETGPLCESCASKEVEG